MRHHVATLLLAALWLSAIAHSSHADDGKLLATPGTTQFEGSGGGGIVPWAMLGGYASREQIAVSSFATRVNVNDLSLTALGAGINVKDRFEITYAYHKLEVDPLSISIRQDIFGAKVRLYGDVVYSQYPQLGLGIQHKRLDDPTIPFAVGASDDTGTDVYLAASKLHLGAVSGYNLLWGLTARATKANEAGLLGFGGSNKDSYSLQLEGSVAVFFNRHIAAGFEYRTKPNNLAAVPEDDWLDAFVAVFPNKHLNITLAYADLGRVAGLGDQRGVYLSLTGYLK